MSSKNLFRLKWVQEYEDSEGLWCIERTLANGKTQRKLFPSKTYQDPLKTSRGLRSTKQKAIAYMAELNLKILREEEIDECLSLS